MYLYQIYDKYGCDVKFCLPDSSVYYRFHYICDDYNDEHLILLNCYCKKTDCLIDRLINIPIDLAINDNKFELIQENEKFISQESKHMIDLSKEIVSLSERNSKLNIEFIDYRSKIKNGVGKIREDISMLSVDKKLMESEYKPYIDRLLSNLTGLMKLTRI